MAQRAADSLRAGDDAVDHDVTAACEARDMIAISRESEAVVMESLDTDPNEASIELLREKAEDVTESSRSGANLRKISEVESRGVGGGHSSRAANAVVMPQEQFLGLFMDRSEVMQRPGWMVGDVQKKSEDATVAVELLSDWRPSEKTGPDDSVTSAHREISSIAGCGQGGGHTSDSAKTRSNSRSGSEKRALKKKDGNHRPVAVDGLAAKPCWPQCPWPVTVGFGSCFVW